MIKNMSNKIKVGFIVAVVAIAMVLYKDHFERKKKEEKSNHRCDHDHDWN